MDPFAHTLVGACLAQTGLGRKTAYATAALVIGANLPDVDGVAMLMGGDTALMWRRGWTHGIPALTVLPFLLAAALSAWSRSVGADERPSFGTLAGLSAIAVWSHPALDWLNTYGMRWWMPIDERWFYGDTLLVVDPWFWLVLSAAVFLFRSRTLASRIGWGLFGLFAGSLLLGVVPGLALAKGLWCAGVAAVIVSRYFRVGFEESSARKLAMAALILLTGYIGAMHVSSRQTARAIAAGLEERGIEVRGLMVGNLPVTPFLRDVVAETPEGYLHGRVRLYPELSMEWAPEPLPLLPDSPVVRAAIASPRVRGFMNWVRFPFAEVEETPTGYRVYLMDARYTRSRASGFGSARVEVPKADLPTHGE